MKILYIDCSFGFDTAKLLGALLDAGADLQSVAASLNDSFKNISFECTDVVRNHLDCKLVEVCAKNDILSAALEKLAEKAIMIMGIDYVIVSAVPVPDDADGEVISTLESLGFDMFPVEASYCIGKDDAHFLAGIVNDHGARPDMDVISVGYGASRADDGLVIATIGYMNTSEINFCFEKAEQFL